MQVETTPLVIEGKLWRFESVRPEYWNNTASPGSAGGGEAGYASPSFFRFVDVATGAHPITASRLDAGGEAHGGRAEGRAFYHREVETEPD